MNSIIDNVVKLYLNNYYSSIEMDKDAKLYVSAGYVVYLYDENGELRTIMEAVK